VTVSVTGVTRGTGGTGTASFTNTITSVPPTAGVTAPADG
jgi:hypothetical protein